MRACQRVLVSVFCPPGKQVLDTQMKMFTHVIRMAAYNTAMTLAREVRTNTGYTKPAGKPMLWSARP